MRRRGQRVARRAAELRRVARGISVANRRRMFRVSLSFAPAALLLAGCLADAAPAHAPRVTDEAAISAMLAAGDFDGAGFVRMNAAPYRSTLEPDHAINMFVSADAAAAYEAVSPDSTSAGAPFPVGGIVVREALDGAGAVAALTVMVKRAPGYFPDVGDF